MVTFDEDDRQRVTSDPLILALDDCRVQALSAVTALRAKHGWGETDWRCICIHRTKNVAASTLALLAFHRSIFPTKAFWFTYFNDLPSENEFDDFYREADVLIRQAVVQGVFSCMESAFRDTVKRFDPDACNKARADLYAIIKYLEARVNRLGNYADLLKLYRLTRNTVHHNGVFQPRDGSDADVAWKGQTYEFRVGKPIAFAKGQFVALLVSEVIAMWRDLLDDPAIAGLPSV